MALDTKQKLYAVYGFGFIGMPAALPDGSLSKDQLLSIAGLVPGLISADPICIRTVTPNRGSVSGGDLISIVVSNGGSISGQVKVGGTVATISYWSDTLIQAVTPAGTLGYADVYVKSSTTQEDTLTNGFMYIPAVTDNADRRTVRVLKGRRTIEVKNVR